MEATGRCSGTSGEGLRMTWSFLLGKAEGQFLGDTSKKKGSSSLLNLFELVHLQTEL